MAMQRHFCPDRRVDEQASISRDFPTAQTKQLLAHRKHDKSLCIAMAPWTTVIYSSDIYIVVK